MVVGLKILINANTKKPQIIKFLMSKVFCDIHNWLGQLIDQKKYRTEKVTKN